MQISLFVLCNSLITAIVIIRTRPGPDCCGMRNQRDGPQHAWTETGSVIDKEMRGVEEIGSRNRPVFYRQLSHSTTTSTDASTVNIIWRQKLQFVETWNNALHRKISARQICSNSRNEVLSTRRQNVLKIYEKMAAKEVCFKRCHYQYYHRPLLRQKAADKDVRYI